MSLGADSTNKASTLSQISGVAPSDEVNESFLTRIDNTLIRMRNREARDALMLAWAVLVRQRAPIVAPSLAAEMSLAAFKRGAVDGEGFVVMESLLALPSYAGIATTV